MALYAARVFVLGKVQDVSCRSFTKKNADLLGLNGFVKNTSDGRVEALIEGDKDQIETLIEAMRIGPDGASVRRVDIEWQPYSPVFNDFKVIY